MMMRRFIPAMTLAALLTTATAFAAPADDYVMMKVNTSNVTSSEVQKMWEGLFPPGSAPGIETIKPEMRDKILRGVMVERLLTEEAIKQGVDKSDAVKQQLEDIRKKLVVKTFLDQKTSDMITDADLKREYDKLVLDLRDQQEAHAKHILVADEKTANEVKAKLAEGKKFEDVAREYSKDPGSAKTGGDLGYFTKEKMVKEFADAAFKLKKGQTSDPIKTPFGWHIIKLEDLRKVTVPTYNESKANIKASLQERKLNTYIQDLVKSATVKLYDAKGKELEFRKEAIPTKM